jgi:hypothetical protein
MAERGDKNQRTIEQPTDIEDDANETDGNQTDFDHLHHSPDIKLKSIEVDDDF